MNQYDYDTDTARRLNILEGLLAEAVVERERAEQKYDTLFLNVFDQFNQTAGVDAPASFVCEDGFKLARIVPQMSPKVDADALKLLCVGDEPRWKRVTDTVRVVNQDKLAAEMKKDPKFSKAISNSDVITIPTRKPSRYRQPASKQEKMVAEIKHAKEDVG